MYSVKINWSILHAVGMEYFRFINNQTNAIFLSISTGTKLILMSALRNLVTSGVLNFFTVNVFLASEYMFQREMKSIPSSLTVHNLMLSIPHIYTPVTEGYCALIFKTTREGHTRRLPLGSLTEGLCTTVLPVIGNVTCVSNGELHDILF